MSTMALKKKYYYITVISVSNEILQFSGFLQRNTAIFTKNGLV